MSNAVTKLYEHNSLENPIGTDGFEFVEYSAPNPEPLHKLFLAFGFTPSLRHKTKKITVYQQGDLTFIINSDPGSFSSGFNHEHGPCASAMALRVKNSQQAYHALIERGAEPYNEADRTFDIPTIKGIGGSLIYLVDQYTNDRVYDRDFAPITDKIGKGTGLITLDHLTNNVYQGNMDQWAEFYVKLFNFRQIRYFDIVGQKTGLISRALSSPCGKIKIPINESKDNISQIEEYLREYKGEGIQHIAFTTDNIYETVESMRAAGVEFMSVPDTYYELVEKRLPGHGEDLARMQRNKILIDGETDQPGKPILLQIFTNTVIGPIFFEVIQRKGHEGFGEGNFTALFESIELDQMRRGVI